MRRPSPTLGAFVSVCVGFGAYVAAQRTGGRIDCERYTGCPRARSEGRCRGADTAKDRRGHLWAWRSKCCHWERLKGFNETGSGVCLNNYGRWSDDTAVATPNLGGAPPGPATSAEVAAPALLPRVPGTEALLTTPAGASRPLVLAFVTPSTKTWPGHCRRERQPCPTGPFWGL